jgi:cobalt-zinc-cadmium efflux system membrane fusion protein
MKAVLIVLSILLCGCQPKTPPAAAESPASKETSKTLTLDEDEQRKAHLAVAVVRSRALSSTLSAPGQLTVNEDQTWMVGAVTGGKVDTLNARVGETVRVRQVLGSIHSHDVHEARAAYQQAVVELERTRSAESYSKRRRDRAQRLLDLKAGARQDVEAADAELRNARAAIENAQSELEKERAHLTDVLGIKVEDGVGGTHDDDVSIVSPGAGIVLQRRVTVGSVVNTGDELFVLSDTGSLWMTAAANEADVSKLRPGQTVRIQVRAFPEREFPGKVLRLGEQLDSTTRTLQVRILVPNPLGLLKPGMYGAASFDESTKRAVVAVPEEAIQDLDGSLVVFVRRSATGFEPRAVRVGRRTNGEAEIEEGLNAGETVVVKGAFQLKSQLLRRRLEEN